MIKKVGYCYYAHISNIRELISELKEKDSIDWLSKVLITNSQRCEVALSGELVNGIYTCNPVIVKYNKKDNSVSLIECEDWDTANEPTVGDSYCFKGDGSRETVIKGGTKVYHNKWQFVSDDYKGFNIEIAKRRTAEWNRIEGIKGLKNRIGSKKFWYNLLREHDLSI